MEKGLRGFHAFASQLLANDRFRKRRDHCLQLYIQQAPMDYSNLVFLSELQKQTKNHKSEKRTLKVRKKN